MSQFVYRRSNTSEKNDTTENQMNNLLQTYLENAYQIINPELELRFGTRGIKTIQRINYENIIKRVKSSGFVIKGGENSVLKIQNQFADHKTGRTKISNIRTEINGLSNIQNYCATNMISDNNPAIQFVKKNNFINHDTGHMYLPVNFDDWNFRLSFQTEDNLNITAQVVRSLIDQWKQTKKIFRLVNRVSLKHDAWPIRIDLSIVKHSSKRGKTMIPEYNIETSGLFTNPEKYEVEVEILKDLVGAGTKYDTIESLNKLIKKVVKLISSGFQQTNFPITYPDQNHILHSYLKLVQGKHYNEEKYVTPSNFIGPSSYTLQIGNIAPINPDVEIPNIRHNYTVTEKADGMRKLLFIDKKGKIYLITTTMSIEFTGSLTKNSELFNSLLDGEHILHNKNKEFINLYAAFDIYFIKNLDIRSQGFYPLDKDDNEYHYRLPQLVKFMSELNPVSIIPKKLTPIRIENKKFKYSDEDFSIFNGCKNILDDMREGLYEYETDGLIFTPMNMGVGLNKIGGDPKAYKITWDHSFKWKPPQYNTIDFLITTKKLENGQDFIGNIFQNGKNTSVLTQLTQYKTLILRVGFDEKKHGFINPCGDIINDNIPSPHNIDKSNSYKPMPFYPTNPYDPEANICNVLIKEDEIGTKKMFTEENEVIEDNMIVEFRYELTQKQHWRWCPLRVRYDKTAEFRSGQRNYGNAYHVANNNWYSIHNPISEHMLSTGENIPDELGDDDIYYNKVSGATQTRGLRDFHNLFVKKLLLVNISKSGDTLIDYAVGKGGDIPKWIAARLSFVLGIDIAKDGLENRLDGACARYLNYRKKFRLMPSALFLHGNSSVNIRNTNALYSEKAKQIARAVFGEGPKDETKLGKGVYKQYGKAHDGFNVSSIQFALHYMFESQLTLQNFLRNISECTKIGGYFTATSYDGYALFNKLKDKKKGESIVIMKDDKKIWGVTKQYDSNEFLSNSSCIGYAIDVYQESINKTFREYLVNYDYLNRLLENYGFVPLTREEYKEKNLPSSSGMFNDLFGLMNAEIARHPKKKNDYGDAPNMDPQERNISFLNRYIIYKKVRAVNAEKMALILMNKTIEAEKEDEKETLEIQNILIAETKKEVKGETKEKKGKRGKKGKLKLHLQEKEN